MKETILRAYDKDNDRMIYSTDDWADFIYDKQTGKFEVHYTEEKTLYVGEEGMRIEMDAPVLVVIDNPQVEILKYNTWMKLFVA